MGDDWSEIRRDIGAIREAVAEMRGAQRTQGEEIARISGRIETVVAAMTAGQCAQDDRINALAVEQGRQRGEAAAKQFWQSWLIPGGVGGVLGWLSRLLPPGPHHP